MTTFFYAACLFFRFYFRVFFFTSTPEASDSKNPGGRTQKKNIYKKERWKKERWKKKTKKKKDEKKEIENKKKGKERNGNKPEKETTIYLMNTFRCEAYLSSRMACYLYATSTFLSFFMYFASHFLWVCIFSCWRKWEIFWLAMYHENSNIYYIYI